MYKRRWYEKWTECNRGKTPSSDGSSNKVIVGDNNCGNDCLPCSGEVFSECEEGYYLSKWIFMFKFM